jgi:chromate reductase
MKTILAISGSSRRAEFDPSIENPFARGSFNSALLKAFEAAAPEGVKVEHVSKVDFPIFDQDLEADFPPQVTELKNRIRAADGVVIATPEYNRSIPPYLKNLVDWTSRPYGDSAWNGKPVYAIGASGGMVGTAMAQGVLKQSLLYLNARVMGQPEFYMTGAHAKFDASGVLTDEDTKKLLASAWEAFLTFIG